MYFLNLNFLLQLLVPQPQIILILYNFVEFLNVPFIAETLHFGCQLFYPFKILFIYLLKFLYVRKLYCPPHLPVLLCQLVYFLPHPHVPDPQLPQLVRPALAILIH